MSTGCQEATSIPTSSVEDFINKYYGLGASFIIQQLEQMILQVIWGKETKLNQDTTEVIIGAFDEEISDLYETIKHQGIVSQNLRGCFWAILDKWQKEGLALKKRIENRVLQLQTTTAH